VIHRYTLLATPENCSWADAVDPQASRQLNANHRPHPQAAQDKLLINRERTIRPMNGAFRTNRGNQVKASSQ
jgi:hypothetical protein